MGLSFLEYTGDGVTNTFPIPFALGVLSGTDVKVRVGDEVDSTGQPLYRDWSYVAGNDGMIRVAGAVPGAGVLVVITRTVSKTELLVDYQEGSPLDERSLDDSNKQLMMAVHEVLDGRAGKSVVDIDMFQHTIRNIKLDKDDPTSAATVGYFNEIEPKLDELLKYEEDILKAANLLYSRKFTPFTTVAGQSIYTLDVQVDPDGVNLLLVLNDVLQEPGKDFIMLDSQRIQFTETPAAGLYAWGCTNNSLANPDIVAIVAKALDDIAKANAAAQKNVEDEGESQLWLIKSAGESQRSAIDEEGTLNLLDIAATGEAARGSVVTTKDAAIVEITNYTEASKSNIQNFTDTITAGISASLDEATAQADRAAEEAAKAEAIVGVGVATREKAGLVMPGSGLTLNNAGLIEVIPTILVETPVLTIDEELPIGYQATLGMEAHSITSATISKFMVVIDGAAPEEVPAVSDVASYEFTVPSGTINMTVTVLAIDSVGNKSQEATKTVRRYVPVVDAPLIIEPVNGATEVVLVPTFTVSAFNVEHFNDTPVMTVLEIASDSEFTTNVERISRDYATTITLLETEALAINSTYFARAKHFGQRFGEGDFGPAMSFSTTNVRVVAPVVSGVIDGATDVLPDVAISVGAFSTSPTGMDSPRESDNFEYAFVNATDVSVIESGTLTLNTSGGEIPHSDLPLNTRIHFKCRWLGKQVTGSYTEVAFKIVNASIAAPSIAGLAHGDVDVPLQPEVTVGPFSVYPAGFDTPKDTNNFFYEFVDVDTDAVLKSGSIEEKGHKTYPAEGGTLSPTNSLPTGTKIKLKCYWIGNKLESPHTHIEFTTVNGYVEQPSIISPEFGIDVSPSAAVFVGSAFASVGASDTHTASQWQVGNSDFSTIYSSVTDEGETSHTFNLGSLGLGGMGVRIRCRYYGSILGWSAWSEALAVIVHQSKFIATFTNSASKGILYSTGGTSWELRSISGVTGQLTSMAYGNAVYVATSDSTSLYWSTNGTSWNIGVVSGTTLTSKCTSIVYGNGVFVATCLDGNILVSPDGKQWTAYNTGFKSKSAPRAVVLAGDTFFVLTGGNDYTHGDCFYSTDGYSWTRTTPTGGFPASCDYSWSVGGSAGGIVLMNSGYIKISTTWKTSAGASAWTSRSLTGISVIPNYGTLYATETAFYAPLSGKVAYGTFAGSVTTASVFVNESAKFYNIERRSDDGYFVMFGVDSTSGTDALVSVYSNNGTTSHKLGTLPSGADELGTPLALCWG